MKVRLYGCGRLRKKNYILYNFVFKMQKIILFLLFIVVVLNLVARVKTPKRVFKFSLAYS